jgi:hypothetical protein
MGRDEQSILDYFSEAQIRALACQNGIKSWQIDSVGMLRRALLQLDVIKGLETNEYVPEKK